MQENGPLPFLFDSVTNTWEQEMRILNVSTDAHTSFSSSGHAVGAIIGIIYIFAFFYYISIKFYNCIIEDLVYLVNYKEDEDKEIYRPIIYCVLNALPVLVFNVSCVVESNSDGGIMLLFATDMVNICLIFGLILLFAVLPKKKEGSDVDGWLLLRDTSYYIIGVVAFLALVHFDLVAWWSGILMLLYWLIHLIILSYNEYIRDQVYLMVGLKHEDDSFNADEQQSQVKRRISITELSYKNLIDKNDEQLKKKIMRMDAILKVKYAADQKKREMLSIWQVAVYTVIFSIKNKHKQEKLLRSANYAKLFESSKDVSQQDEDEQNNNNHNDSDSDNNINPNKNEDEELIDKKGQKQSQNDNKIKMRQQLLGKEGDKENKKNNNKDIGQDDFDDIEKNDSKKAESVNSHKADENQQLFPHNPIAADNQSEDDVKQTNNLLRNIQNNNDNQQKKKGDDRVNKVTIDGNVIKSKNNANDVEDLQQTDMPPMGEDKFQVGLSFPTKVLDQFCYVVFFPIHLIIYFLPNYHINPSHRKLAASFFITVVIISGLMIALQYLMDNLNSYFGGHNSAYSLSITAFFLQLSFFTYNYEFAKKEKDPIDFLLTFIQLGIYKTGIVLGITIIVSAIFSLQTSTDIYFNDNYWVVLIIVAAIVFINGILIRITSLKANKIVAIYLVCAYIVFLLSGVILLAF